MSMFVAASARSRALAALALCFAVGCSSAKKPLPKAVPAGGKVVSRDGKPWTGGQVLFAPVNETGVTTTGEIKEDGSFTLSSFTAKEKVEGAPPGEYTVTMTPSQGGDQAKATGTSPVSLKEKFEVKEGGDNNFTIKVDPPKK